MALIDSNNFITLLVWSGLIDKATCGELKEAIELCTVKDIYTKADVVAMLEELKKEIEELKPNNPNFKGYHEQKIALNKASDIIQQKIDALKEKSRAQDKEFWDKVAEELKPAIKRALEETFVKPKLTEKSCNDCDRLRADGKCSAGELCINRDLWEPIHNCSTCKWEELAYDNSTCKSCNDCDKWEAKK